MTGSEIGSNNQLSKSGAAKVAKALARRASLRLVFEEEDASKKGGTVRSLCRDWGALIRVTRLGDPDQAEIGGP